MQLRVHRNLLLLGSTTIRLRINDLLLLQFLTPGESVQGLFVSLELVLSDAKVEEALDARTLNRGLQPLNRHSLELGPVMHPVGFGDSELESIFLSLVLCPLGPHAMLAVGAPGTVPPPGEDVAFLGSLALACRVRSRQSIVGLPGLVDEPLVGCRFPLLLQPVSHFLECVSALATIRIGGVFHYE